MAEEVVDCPVGVKPTIDPRVLIGRLRFLIRSAKVKEMILVLST